MNKPQLENPMTFFRSLKGAPISVLVVLLATQRAMTALELSQWTGYKGDNITEATRYLTTSGWLVAQSARGPWAFSQGRQLPLMANLDDLLQLVPNSDSDLIGVAALNVVDADSKNVFPSITTTTTLTGSGNPIKSESRKPKLTDVQKACIAALKIADIHGKKARDLVALPWVTVEYINAHWLKIQGETWDNPQGMMVYRIEGEEPAPEIQTVNKKGRRTFSFICDNCQASPCECEDHALDCICITCQKDHPERFCTFEIVTHGSARTCGGLVIPGAIYCKAHEVES